MTQVIRLKAHYPEHQIQKIRLDNAAEFSSRAFNDYCMAQGIHIEHSVPYVLSGTIIRGTLKTPNSQLVTLISIKLQRPDGCD